MNEPSRQPNDNVSHLAKKLNQSEAVFRLLVSSVQDYAIFMLDPSGHVLSWNEGAHRIKGYEADEVIGKHFSIFYTPEGRDSGHPAHELQIAKSQGRYEEEGWRVRKDGTMFWANVVVTPLWDDDGSHVGFAKVTRDLSERKRAEERRAEDERLLYETMDELQRLAYVVSHEMQAPISSIDQYGRLLSVRYKDQLGDDAREFIGKILTASKVITRMVDDLWTYARLSKSADRSSLLYMGNVLNDALEEIEPYRGNAVITHNEMPSLEGNRQQLVYLFKELIQNAIRSADDRQANIRLHAIKDQSGWLFSVKDNGRGIDTALGGEVFRLFYKFGSSEPRDSTGVGLSICKKIVTQHGGRLWFEPNADVGTTFYFWLPDTQEQKQAVIYSLGR